MKPAEDEDDRDHRRAAGFLLAVERRRDRRVDAGVEEVAEDEEQDEVAEHRDRDPRHAQLARRQDAWRSPGSDRFIATSDQTRYCVRPTRPMPMILPSISSVGRTEAMMTSTMRLDLLLDDAAHDLDAVHEEGRVHEDHEDDARR